MTDFWIEAANLNAFLNFFRGRNTEQLEAKTCFSTRAKNKNSLLIKRIRENYKGKEWLSCLENSVFTMKTIQLNKNGKTKEARSFPMFDYSAVRSEEFEQSDIYQQLSAIFLFCVFQETDNGNLFLGSFFWRRPEEDLEGEVKEVYGKVKFVLQSGDVVKEDGKKILLNFPREKDTKVCHVRPHGRNALDLARLPIRDKRTNYLGLTKQSFWLNHDYINSILESNRKLLLQNKYGGH